jgi:Flp pilus assembly CpaE family ATPase
MGLRESLRYLEYCRDILKVPVPIFVANRVGVAGKHQMPQSEFEKGLGAKIDYVIPLVMDAHAAATEGKVLAEKTKNSPAVKAFRALAERFAAGAEVVNKKQEKPGLLSFMKKEK